MLRDEGGALIPMFFYYLDGIANNLNGYEPDINGEVADGRFCEFCWLAA
jgi:hypothetical protein